jgi:hypothetical protein
MEALMAWQTATPSALKPDNNNGKTEASDVQIGEHRLHASYEPQLGTIINSEDHYNYRIFKCYGGPDLSEGWKLHVPIQDDGLLDQSFPHLLRCLKYCKIPHKFVRTRLGLAAMEKQNTQVGKFLTIYPPNRSDMLDLVTGIEDSLTIAKYARRKVSPGERPVGNFGIVTARYGGLTTDKIYANAAFQRGSALTKGDFVPDNRTTFKPAWVPDIWANNNNVVRQHGFVHPR